MAEKVGVAVLAVLEAHSHYCSPSLIMATLIYSPAAMAAMAVKVAPEVNQMTVELLPVVKAEQALLAVRVVMRAQLISML